MSGENLTPITRKEMFLAKASGQNIQTPTPITREEYFLSKITGGGGSGIIEVDELPTENIDANAFYLCDGEYYKWVESDVWVLNDELNFDELTADVVYPANFTIKGNPTAYTGFTYTERGQGVYGLAYQHYAYGSNQNQFVYLNAPLWGMPAGWSGEESKYVIFTKMPTDETFLTWWYANAKKQSGFQKYISQPPIYHLASVDELPTDAVDDSVAIVKKTLSYWTLNDKLIHPSDEYGECKMFFMVGISEGYLYYKAIQWDTYRFFFVQQSGVVVYNFGDDSENSGWVVDGRNYIEPYVAYADETAVAWLEANGTYNGDTGEASLVYIRKNGEWVIEGVIA